MVGIAGRYTQAAREAQELNFRRRSHVADRIRSLQHISPVISPELIKIITHGEIPEYKGFLPPNERRLTRYPYIIDDTEKIVKKLWKDIRDGITIVCEMDVDEGHGQVISHSSSVAHKKMPGRTLSIDYRIVPDLRQINMGDDKGEFYPVEAVKLTDITDLISRLQRQFSTLPVMMAKRDIPSAFRRILLHPHLIHIFTTDIPGDVMGRMADIFTGHLPMSFGWVASPAYFKLHTDAIASVRSYFWKGGSLSGGRERFASYIYADDWMLIECPIGNRLSACASCWEWSCQKILADYAISDEKKGLECHRSQRNTLIGFEVATEHMVI